MNDQGESTVADVVAACDWILQNKDQYNIRVANFSLHAMDRASLFFDPLDQAVEKLWLNGVVVVTAAGNYATDGQESGVPFAPGNDPFVITVGASDINDTVDTSDDTVAPWSAWGYTPDGFMKPDLVRSGPLHDRAGLRRRRHSRSSGRITSPPTRTATCSSAARRSRRRWCRERPRCCWPSIPTGRPTRSRAR